MSDKVHALYLRVKDLHVHPGATIPWRVRDFTRDAQQVTTGYRRWLANPQDTDSKTMAFSAAHSLLGSDASIVVNNEAQANRINDAIAAIVSLFENDEARAA